MAVTEEKLAEFRLWMLGRGRTETTSDLYVLNIRRCLSDPNGPTGRLVSRSLAPNTLRTNMAALRAWALFTEDAKLTRQLADMRLPPARRIRPKIPLELDDLRRFVAHLRSCRMQDGRRNVLLIMAKRGLRSGDVLRIQRIDVIRSLGTGRLIYEGKGRKQTDISATPILAELKALSKIDDWSRVSDLVSTSTKPKTLQRVVLRASKRAGKAVGVPDVYPHRLRRTFATQYLKRLEGDPNALVKLKKYMNWEALSTAAGYVDAVSDDELDEIGAGLASGLLD